MRTSSDHDSTRGYEWWLMVEAHKRNPNIVLEILPWGAPGWVGSDTLYTAKMAEYVADFIKAAKHDYSLDIAFAGAWNEKVFDIPYVKELNRRLQAEHLDTRIICCDEYPGEDSGQWAIANEIVKDQQFATAIQVIGVHYRRSSTARSRHEPSAQNRKAPLVERRSAQLRRRTYC